MCLLASSTLLPIQALCKSVCRSISLRYADTLVDDWGVDDLR